MEVLDVQSGVRNVGGNEALYNKLLRKYADSNANIMDTLVNAISSDHEAAVRTAHTLKGTSASLGLMKVSEIAATAEHTLAKNEPLSEEVLGNLAAEVSAALAAIEARLK
jgi:HPt (histidine-containing phosphotransfer) domain-containing protein